MNKPVASIIAFALLVCLAVGTLRTQTLLDRWSLGIRAGVNYWISDYNQYKVGIGGSVLVRYDPMRYFGFGLSVGYEVLKTYQSGGLNPYPYIDYMKLNVIPVAVLATLHFYPRKTVNPYVYAGLGAIIFQRTNGAAAVYPVDQKWRTSYMVPVGFGVEDFISRDASIDANLGFMNFADWVDARPTSSFKGYISLKLGINYYLNEGFRQRIGGTFAPR